MLSLPYRWLSIGMFSIIFLAAFEAMAVTTIMPLVADDLDGVALFALAFAVPLAAGIIGMVIAGNWTDRAGPLPSLVTSAVLFVVGLVIAGTATDMVVFIVGRFVHGLSGAAVIVPLYVIVRRICTPSSCAPASSRDSPRRRVIPSIIGPALAGVVAEALSWHWVFLGVIGLLVPAAGMMLPPILRVRDPGAGRRLGAVEPRPGRLVRAHGGGGADAVALEGVRGAMATDHRRRVDRAGRRGGAAAHAAGHTARRAQPARRPCCCGSSSRARSSGDEIYLPYLFIERYEFSPSLAGAVLTGSRGLVGGPLVAAGPARRPGVEHAGRADRGRAARRSPRRGARGRCAWTLNPIIAFVAWTLAGVPRWDSCTRGSRWRC